MEHRQKEKASYGGLFDKGPMYNDKEVCTRADEAFMSYAGLLHGNPCLTCGDLDVCACVCVF